MMLIVERWEKQKVEGPEGIEEAEVIVEERIVASEDEARSVAGEFKENPSTVRVTLHYCRHDEGKPCERVEI